MSHPRAPSPLLLVCLLAACEFRVTTTISPGWSWVVELQPFPNERAADPGAPIAIAFSRDLEPRTVTSASFTLRNGFGLVAAEVGYDPFQRVAWIAPSLPLSEGTAYEAALTTDVTDRDGQRLPDAISWNFVTNDTRTWHAPEPFGRAGRGGAALAVDGHGTTHLAFADESGIDYVVGLHEAPAAKKRVPTSLVTPRLSGMAVLPLGGVHLVVATPALSEQWVSGKVTDIWRRRDEVLAGTGSVRYSAALWTSNVLGDLALGMLGVDGEGRRVGWSTRRLDIVAGFSAEVGLVALQGASLEGPRLALGSAGRGLAAWIEDPISPTQPAAVLKLRGMRDSSAIVESGVTSSAEFSELGSLQVATNLRGTTWLAWLEHGPRGSRVRALRADLDAGVASPVELARSSPRILDLHLVVAENDDAWLAYAVAAGELANLRLLPLAGPGPALTIDGAYLPDLLFSGLRRFSLGMDLVGNLTVAWHHADGTAQARRCVRGRGWKAAESLSTGVPLPAGERSAGHLLAVGPRGDAAVAWWLSKSAQGSLARLR